MLILEDVRLFVSGKIDTKKNNITIVSLNLK